MDLKVQFLKQNKQFNNLTLDEKRTRWQRVDFDVANLTTKLNNLRVAAHKDKELVEKYAHMQTLSRQILSKLSFKVMTRKSDKCQIQRTVTHNEEQG